MRNSELSAFLIASCPKVAPFRLGVGVRRSEELASRGCKRTGELARNAD